MYFAVFDTYGNARDLDRVSKSRNLRLDTPLFFKVNFYNSGSYIGSSVELLDMLRAAAHLHGKQKHLQATAVVSVARYRKVHV